MSGFGEAGKGGKGHCRENINNAPWLRHQSTAGTGSRPDKTLYANSSPEALMRSIQTGEGGRNRQANTMLDGGRLSENSPAIAYRNNLLDESMRRTNMVQSFSQA